MARLKQPGSTVTGTATYQAPGLQLPGNYSGYGYAESPYGSGIDVGDQPDNGNYDISDLFPSYDPNSTGRDTYRTNDFRDIDNSGTDDRDESGGSTDSDPGLMAILGKYDYGVKGLEAARAELEKYGYGVQEGDFLRGRIKEPDGDIVDVFDPREGRTETNNWFNNPIEGGAWNYLNRGQAGLDAGGWSFGGGGGTPVTPGIPTSPTSGGGGGSPSPTAGGGGGTPTGAGRPDIWAMLTKLIGENGEGNNEILTRRVERAREDMNRTRSSQTDQYRAMLADRGLIGSGGEVMGIGRLEENLANTFADAESGIIADESERQDARMMQALSLATGLSMDEARNAIERYKADITRELGLGNLDLGRGRLDLDRTLGLGNLALGNANLNQDWNMFAANFGLDRERFANDVNQGNFDQLARLLDFVLRGAQTSSGGYV